MLLKQHSDASYLTELFARSRAGGFFYLGNKPGKPDPDQQAAVLALTSILKNVVASAAEAEIGALFHNLMKGVVLRTTLEEMGHPQPATPVQVDNSTACGFANKTIKQQRSRAIDMRYYWIQDRVDQGQFVIYWGPGETNRGDFLTKHFSPADHRRLRGQYLVDKNENKLHLALCEGVLIPVRNPDLRQTLQAQ
jgi:hypothetical protein